MTVRPRQWPHFPSACRVSGVPQPADRRFHAQPVACPDCGPALEWRAGDITASREAALSAAVAMLKSGGIVAVKGLGGFHLVCDARNPQAVATLRARKQRPSKPLAVMIPHADGLPEAIQTLLRSSAAPIVLTPKASLPGFPKDCARLLCWHHASREPAAAFLMMDCQRPLVMTSGNLSGRPPAMTNQQALDELGDIADGFLLHNRDILQRMDDSVMDRDGAMLRRARGFVPDAITLPAGLRISPPCCAPARR
jgi:hydrogenase maturation protein HypF